MRKLLVIVFTVSMVAAIPLWAQTSAESQKLNYFAGTWRLEVHLIASAVGGKAFFGTEHNEWMPGGSLLLSRQEEESPITGGGLTVLAYDAQNKTYRYHQVKNSGESEDLRGTFENGIWTWITSAAANQARRTRLTMREISDTSYVLKLETASEGHDWSTVMEGKATKILRRTHQDVAFLR
jgi:hypothetical protein